MTAAVGPVADRSRHVRGPVSAEPLIRLRGLTKRYGTLTAVDRLSLEIHRGEIFGLLGPNGAGKTTTILMMLGLSEPTDGEVHVLGLDPSRNPLDVKRRVGYLPDSAGFYGGLTGRENLRYTARLNRLGGSIGEERIALVLDQVGLTTAADRRVETYSRGMQQRLGIADALVKDPEILILDEPTVAIDPIGVAEILDLMRALVRDRGLALLLASHLLDQVQSVCDRVGIFSSGRLIASGTVEELAARYGDERQTFVVGVERGAGLDGAAAARAFGAIPGVRSVEPLKAAGDDDLAWTLTLADGAAVAAVRQAIVATVVAEGLQLTRLNRGVASLDQIYRHAVERATSPTVRERQGPRSKTERSGSAHGRRRRTRDARGREGGATADGAATPPRAGAGGGDDDEE